MKRKAGGKNNTINQVIATGLWFPDNVGITTSKHE